MVFGNDVPGVEAAAVPDGAYLVDVREPDEWAAGHAPDAHHLPLGELAVRADEIPRDREVYVVCRIGSRSAQAVAALNHAGWRTTNVSDGMWGWAAAGRPMVRTDADERGGDGAPYVA
jgi:rhodanese-related sulfurtransferase